MNGDDRCLAVGISAVVAFLAACTDRVDVSSGVGRQVAERLCPIQSNCSCDEYFDDHQEISRCEAEVEQEIGQHERQALDRGLVLSSDCLAVFLDEIDGSSACGSGPPWQTESCPVYSGTAEVGEPCQIYEFFPVMTDCRPGLACREGLCRNVESPPILDEGEICSETQSILPSGFLGMCREGLICDSNDTRRCITYVEPPRIPLGEECAAFFSCEGDSYCRPQEGTSGISEEMPGICSAPTPTGQPCSFALECEEWLCEVGTCTSTPPKLCGALKYWHESRSALE